MTWSVTSPSYAILTPEALSLKTMGSGFHGPGRRTVDSASYTEVTGTLSLSLSPPVPPLCGIYVGTERNDKVSFPSFVVDTVINIFFLIL